MICRPPSGSLSGGVGGLTARPLRESSLGGFVRNDLLFYQASDLHAKHRCHQASICRRRWIRKSGGPPRLSELVWLEKPSGSVKSPSGQEKTEGFLTF